MENNLIWNAGCLRISHRGGQTGIRYTGDEVGIGREGTCESSAAAQPCLIDAHIIDVAVEAGKIDVFENAVRPFFLLQAFIRKNAVAGDGHDLTRFDISDWSSDVCSSDLVMAQLSDAMIQTFPFLPRQRGRRPNGSRTPISLRGLEIIRA